jgi:hypothetical protein
MKWKPTADECLAIKEAAARTAYPRLTVNTVVLEPGRRVNVDDPSGSHINIALVSSDPEFNDTDLDDYGAWSEFRKGVPLTEDGRAIVDFYIRRRGDQYGDLLGHVTIWYENGKGITRWQCI